MDGRQAPAIAADRFASWYNDRDDREGNMRAAFNSTCDVMTGPAGVPPNTVVATNVPCRIVSDALIVRRSKVMSRETAHVTMDAHEPTGMMLGMGATDYSGDTDTHDLLAIPSGAAFDWHVVWVEVITPNVGSIYFRVYVAPLIPWP